MNKKNWPLIRIGLVLFLIGVFVYLFWEFIGVFIYHEFITGDDWKEKTVPLSERARSELCANFSLTDNHLCTGETHVYGPEFYRYINDYFGKDSTEQFSMQDVDAKLGEFLLFCQPYGENFVACYYDLAGDNVFRIVAFFTKEGSLYSISANVD